MPLGRLFLKSMLGALAAVLVIGLTYAAASAKGERTLTWEELSPAMPDLRAPFSHLTDDQFADLYDLFQLVQWQALPQSANDTGLAQQIEELTTGLKARSIDTDALLRKLNDRINEYERVEQTPVAELNGQVFRLPGFVLPLEFGEEQTVSEFFLVPYYGACIHTPPPPANQIVLVRLDQSYAVKSLYEAVWVTGRLKVVKNDRKLGYSDGVGQVASAYELEDVKIAPYQ